MAVDLVRHGDVGLNRHGLAAGRGDGRHHLLGLLGTGAVVDDHPIPVFAPVPMRSPHRFPGWLR